MHYGAQGFGCISTWPDSLAATRTPIPRFQIFRTHRSGQALRAKVERCPNRLLQLCRIESDEKIALIADLFGIECRHS